MSLACLVAIGLISAVYHLKHIAFIAQYLTLITAAILLYVPIAIYFKRREPFDFLDRSIPQSLRAIGIFLLFSFAVFPILSLGNHVYQAWIWNLHFRALPSADTLVGLFLSQLLFIALPEEFFFRGYVQARLNQLYAKKWRILGVTCGPAWLLTALIFAVSHSVITIRWWHIFIFFPALAFGWLKEKTGTILAPSLFHAASNIFAYAVFSNHH